MADGPHAVTDDRLHLARSLLGHLETGDDQGAAERLRYGITATEAAGRGQHSPG